MRDLSTPGLTRPFPCIKGTFYGWIGRKRPSRARWAGLPRQRERAEPDARGQRAPHGGRTWKATAGGGGSEWRATDKLVRAGWFVSIPTRRGIHVGTLASQHVLQGSADRFRSAEAPDVSVVGPDPVFRTGESSRPEGFCASGLQFTERSRRVPRCLQNHVEMGGSDVYGQEGPVSCAAVGLDCFEDEFSTFGGQDEGSGLGLLFPPADQAGASVDGGMKSIATPG